VYIFPYDIYFDICTYMHMYIYVHVHVHVYVYVYVARACTREALSVKFDL